MSNFKFKDSLIPNLFIVPFLQFLFLFITPIFSQEKIKIGEEEYSKNLEFAEEIGDFPNGSFYLTTEDFIMTAGQMFKGNPPPSRVEFKFKEETIKNLGEFNNKIIGKILSRTEGSIKEAEEMLEAAVEFDPVFFPVRYNLARVLELNWNFKFSKFHFEKASKLIPNYYRTFYHLGLIEQRLGNFPNAIDHFRKAVKLHPFRDEAKSMLCVLSYVKGYPASYRKVLIENYPDTKSTNASICQAIVFYNSENFGKAYEILNKLNPMDKEENIWKYLKSYHYYLADSSDRVGEIETSLKNWKKLLEFPFDPLYMEIKESTVKRKIEIAEFILQNRKKPE